MANWNRNVKILTAILLSGLALRLALSPFFADYNDFSYWTGTAFDVMNGNGVYRGYDYWYPPVWGYVIAAVTPLIDLFGCTPVDTVIDGASSSGYWVGDGFVSDPLAVFIIKLPLVLADTACGYLVYSVTKKITSDERKALMTSAFWLFCPLTVFTSAVQGQFETIEALFILLALWSYLKGSYTESGAFVAAAVLTKPFAALILLPLMALVWTRGQERDRRLKFTGMYIAGGLVMTAFVVLPQLIFGETEYLFGFLSNRSAVDFPLPSDFSMSITVLETEQSFGDLLSPSGSNVSTLFPISMLLSIVLAVFVLIRNRMTDLQAVLLITAATCLHLIWYPATGYSQYYVPVIAMLSICTALDKRFLYAAIGVIIVTMTTALWGFHHAYQLYDWGVASVEALNDFYSDMRAVLDIPDTITTHLKFVPVLATVIISMIIVRGPSDEA